MNIKIIKVGMLQTNCYILEKNDECLVIDPGDESDKIISNINKNVAGILLTHRHFDHVGALDDIKNYYKVNVYDKSNLVNGMNKISSFDFYVSYNPGHTMDSISFIFGDVMFSGDFIFKDAIGRCDLGGDFSLMRESINNLLRTDINYKIYPGHGDFTYLNEERNSLTIY